MLRLYILASLILSVLAACAAPSAPAQQQNPPASEVSQGTKTQMQSAPAAAEWQTEWDKVLARAKKEGVVAVGITGGATMRDALITAFRNRYGIRVETMFGKSAQITEKILTEQRAGLYLLDVQITGATSPVISMKPAGALVPLETALIRPDMLDAQYWFPGHPFWVDKGRFILTIEFNATGKLGINTDLVKPGEIKYLRDLINPKWKGKIIINDPTVTGTGAKFVGVVAYQQGWDIWREIARQEPVVMRDERLMVEWLVRGKYSVIIAPKTEPMFDAMSVGAPVVNIAAEDSRYAGGDTISMLKNAPNPNAAVIFINWILSQEGQTVYHTAQGSWSGRKDVILNSDPAKKPEPGVRYFNSNDEEFLMKQPEQMNMAREIFGHQ